MAAEQRSALALFAQVPETAGPPSAVPSFDEEEALWRLGFRAIAGLDEVGRGPLAGPLVAAAVVLYPQPGTHAWLEDLRDSKLLSAAKREDLSALIREHGAVGIGVAGHDEIDRLGMGPAWRRAMLLAVEELPLPPDFLLLDGRDRLPTSTGQKAVIKGDRLIRSVAAASIVAKVYRDRLMEELEQRHPGWGLGHHKGYATRQHMDALRAMGPSPVHRRSFAPIRDMVSQQGRLL